MTTQTISEKILSAHCGHPVRAGEFAVCRVDCVIGTDGSGPMAIDYFEQMGGQSLFDPARVFFSLDHYAPPDTPQTMAFHRRIREFAASHGATVFEVGDGISHQVAVDRGLVGAGDLVVGADSHTVTCGALNAFAIGVGSSDLAAAMLTGEDLVARAGDHSCHLARPPAGGCRGEGCRAVPDPEIRWRRSELSGD